MEASIWKHSMDQVVGGMGTLGKDAYIAYTAVVLETIIE